MMDPRLVLRTRACHHARMDQLAQARPTASRVALPVAALVDTGSPLASLACRQAPLAYGSRGAYHPPHRTSVRRADESTPLSIGTHRRASDRIDKSCQTSATRQRAVWRVACP